MAARHRIIRRGMPYGAAETGDCGLAFICFNADIARQFETVHSQWCLDGNAYGLGDDRDWLLTDGRGTRKATIQGVPPFFMKAREPLVTVLGCAYLLMPSVDALQDIAGRAW
jgi:hypothetical protein